MFASPAISAAQERGDSPINDTLTAALTFVQSAEISRYVVEGGGRRVGSIKTGFSAAVARAGIDH